ncbi:MAG: hypothetical protein NC392_14630 [Roseburia sp.]|nr:hypothetical protein [Roseburia sp.]
MSTIEISDQYIQTGAEHSSSGRQLKWRQDGYWYKADRMGFESLAESLVSHLLQHSNIEDFTAYEPVMIRYKDETYRGCRCADFQKENEEIVSLEHLAKSHTGFGLETMLARITDVREKILYTVELVENVTGLEDFGVYLTKLLELDAFFLNTGRDTENITLLYDIETGEYRFCPVFDMGDALFSDTKEKCPLTKGMVECYHAVAARPFSETFDEQLAIANELYGSYLKFNISTTAMINAVRDMVSNRKNDVDYQATEIRRIGEILRFQTRKYQKMFSR